MRSGVGKVEFQSVGQNRRRDTEVWLLDAQVHPFHEFVVMAGSQYVRIGGQDIRGSAGGVLFYRSGEVHKEWTEPGQSLLSLFISFSLRDSAAWRDAPADEAFGLSNSGNYVCPIH